ncbi:MAG: cyanophycin synthetase [Actinobacteria bacterium]|nr:cyanophycin synthetase [Actinomycetota bacterium]
MDATTHFDLSHLRAYPGPSVSLAVEAVAFELSSGGGLPGGDLWAAVLGRLPGLTGEEPPRTFAELFARAVIEVQRLDMGLFATRWSVTAADDGVVTVAVQYVDPDVCRRCVELVADWLRDELEGRAFDFDARYAAVLRRFLRSHFGGPTIYSLLEAGYRAGIPDFYLESEDVVQWGYGRKQLRGRSTVLHRDSIKDTELTTYKDRAKAFLDDLGLPVPRGEIVFELDEAQHAAAQLGFPVVTKPVAGHKGQGVTTGISSERDVKMGFELAAQASGSADDGVIVEQQMAGTDHRLLTVGGRFVAALQRVPAYVVGDGEHTVQELIALENARPERADTPRSPMGKIEVDDNLMQLLGDQGLSLRDVPALGEELVLRRVANLSQGGVSVNVTDVIHPLNAKLAEDVARFLDVHVLGIDVLAEDITRPWTESPCAIIEINAGPGVFMHLVPAQGESIDVPSIVLQGHFPTPQAARVPVLVFNRLDAATAMRLTELGLRCPGVEEVGVTRLDGLYFNNELFSRRPEHLADVRNMMRSPRLDMALIEYDERHLLDEGLYNWGADVVVLERATRIERETLTRDLQPGGLVIEVDEAAGLLHLTPREGEPSTRPLGDSLADSLADALAAVLAGMADFYNVQNAVDGNYARPH